MGNYHGCRTAALQLVLPDGLGYNHHFRAAAGNHRRRTTRLKSPLLPDTAGGIYHCWRPGGGNYH